MSCPHITAGCNYPQGDCLGACLADKPQQPATWPKFRDMTLEQQAAWGAAEAAARMADLADSSLEGLRRAQANAEARRKAIGASKSAATALVIEANRSKRRAQAI